jgi:hypothetical protein
MHYFVTVNGIETATNLTRSQAIREADKQYDKNQKKGTLNIGIGRIKMRKGEKFYTLLPMHFFQS